MKFRLLWLVLPAVLLLAPAAFAAPYTITTAVSSGGTVTPPKGKTLVDQNGSLNVTYTASPGYYLSQVLVDKLPVDVTDRQSFTYQFANVTANHTIAGKFAKNPVINAKAKGGTINPSGKISVPYGAAQTFTYNPQEGYHLASVVVDRLPVDAPSSYSFASVTAPHAITVNFAINTYNITTQAGPGGFIAPAGFAAVKHGQKKVFTIKPNAGMKIATLTVNGEPVPAESLPASGPYKLPLTVTGNTAIAATFTEIVLSGTQRLQGTYRIVEDWNSFRQQTGANQPISEGAQASVITATFDGKGACKVTVDGKSFSRGNDQNGNEIVNVEQSGSPSGCSYSVSDNDGTFTLNISNPEGSDTITGWLSTDSNLLLIGGYRQENGTGWHEYATETVTGVKSGSGISKATFAGTYHLVSRDTTLLKITPQADKSLVTDNLYGDIVTIVFDATGGCSFTDSDIYFSRVTDNVGNEYVAVDPHSAAPPECSYSISSNGTFTFTTNDPLGDGKYTVTGWASADSNTLVIGGVSQETDGNETSYNTFHTVGVRAGSGMTAASFNGTYNLIGGELTFVQSMINGTSFVNKTLGGTMVTATFDGVGQCTITYTNESYYPTIINNTPTVQVESDSGTMSACSYTVQPDGAFTLTMTGQDGTETVTGRASADGSTLLIGGPSVETDDVNNSLYRVDLMVGTRIQ